MRIVSLQVNVENLTEQELNQLFLLKHKSDGFPSPPTRLPDPGEIFAKPPLSDEEYEQLTHSDPEGAQDFVKLLREWRCEGSEGK